MAGWLAFTSRPMDGQIGGVAKEGLYIVGLLGEYRYPGTKDSCTVGSGFVQCFECPLTLSDQLHQSSLNFTATALPVAVVALTP